MSSRHAEDIVLRITGPDQLFNAPAVDPFSEKEIEVQGESGIDYIVHQLQAHRGDWKSMHLVVQLPPDQISPGFDQQLSEALHRYCRARISRNVLQIHLTRVNSAAALGILLVIVFVIIGSMYLLFTTVLSGLDKVIQVVIASLISLFAWVSLWDPLEALIFNPFPQLKENAILQRVMTLPIQVEPDQGHGVGVRPEA